MSRLRNMTLKVSKQYLYKRATLRKNKNMGQSHFSYIQNPKIALKLPFYVVDPTCRSYVANKILWNNMKSYNACSL